MRSFPRPLIFDLIQRTGDVAGPRCAAPALRLGMVLAVATDDADRTAEVRAAAGRDLCMSVRCAPAPGGCVLNGTQPVAAVSVGGAMGGRTVTVVPHPRGYPPQSCPRAPPRRSGDRRDNPIPVPVSLVVKKGSKSRSCSSGGMPEPVSVTAIATSSPSSSVVMVSRRGCLDHRLRRVQA